MAVDLGCEWRRIAPVRASASPVETAVEPIVCRNVWGEIPGSPAFLMAFDQTPFVPWKCPSPRSAGKTNAELVSRKAAQDSDCRHPERTNRFPGLDLYETEGCVIHRG